MNLITSKETAEILGCSVTTISKMVRKGILKPINTQKGFCLFDNDEIQKLSEYRKANNIRCFTVQDKNRNLKLSQIQEVILSFRKVYQYARVQSEKTIIKKNHY